MIKEDLLSNALVVAGSQKQPFVVSYNNYKGRRLLDVRKYYTVKKTGEVKPTQKGVALNKLQFEVLSNLLQEKSDEIENWFKVEDSEKSAELRALEISRLSTPKAKIEFESWAGLEMFKYLRNGKDSVLLLNSKHPWVKEFQSQFETESNSTNPLNTLIVSLLDAFFRSVSLIDPKNENASEILETLIGNWSIFAKKGRQESS